MKLLLPACPRSPYAVSSFLNKTLFSFQAYLKYS
jgi:hypothetical protein